MNRKRKYILSILLTAVFFICSLYGRFNVFANEYNFESIPCDSIEDLQETRGITTIVKMDRSRTIADIINMSNTLKHSGFDRNISSLFVNRPSYTPPYEAGSLCYNKVIVDARNTVKMVRYIAGLPYEDIELTSELNNIAQHGATLLAASGQFTHYPTKPDDMDYEFFDIAYRGCREANIYSGKTNVSNAILGFVADSGANNIERAGHRRWILKPGAKNFGVGYANKGDRYSRRINMHVLDGDDFSVESDSYIAWPSSGYFPIKYFTFEESVPPYPWSVNLGYPYSEPIRDNVTVTLTRKRDNKTWVFNKNTPQLGLGSYEPSMHFSVDNGMSGMKKAIIFRPDLQSLGTINDGDVFNVAISGIKYTNGSDAVLEYSIDFFDLDAEMNKQEVNFYVTHENIPVAYAEITVDGKTIKTDQSGNATVRLLNGKSYAYSVTAKQYENFVGRINIAGINLTENIELTKLPPWDITGDGYINSKDIVFLSQYLAKWNVSFTEEQKKAADVHKDGIINSKDIIKLAQYLAK